MTMTTTIKYSGCDTIPPDQGLINEGWAFRGVPLRGYSRGIDDILELYEELGFEVRLEQHHTDLSEMLDDMARKLEDLKMSVDSIEVRLGKNPFTRDHFRKEADDEATWRHIWAGDDD